MLKCSNSLDKCALFIMFLYDMSKHNTYSLSMTWNNIMFVEGHDCSINSTCTGCTSIRYYIFSCNDTWGKWPFWLWLTLNLTLMHALRFRIYSSLDVYSTNIMLLMILTSLWPLLSYDLQILHTVHNGNCLYHHTNHLHTHYLLFEAVM